MNQPIDLRATLFCQPREQLQDFYEYVYNYPKILPDSWQFPWGSADDSVKFNNAITALAFYHIVSVYFGAGRFNLIGGGLNDVGLVLSPRELGRRICLISGLDKITCDRFIQGMTFGFKVNSPDPALQPFIPVSDEDIFVPCMLILTNNWPRNLLSLHARVGSRTFDAQSSIFETRMVAQILGKSSAYKVIPNKEYSADGWKEEVDLLYIDEINKTVLLCELKWSIPPGDAREVQHRKAAMREKVSQICRKTGRFNSQICSILKQAHVDDCGDTWSVLGLVITDGYVGVPSSDPNNFPIVPMLIFERLIGMGLTVGDIHSILCTPLWLPRVGIDISMHETSYHLDSVEIRDTGYSFSSDRFIDDRFESYVNDAMKYTHDQRMLLNW